jgi:hypothetical protein
MVLFFSLKLQYNNSRFILNFFYKNSTMLLINVYHEDTILNTLTSVGYNTYAACIFSVENTINLQDLRRQIHAVLDLLPSQLTITINVRINIAQISLDVLFIAHLG